MGPGFNSIEYAYNRRAFYLRDQCSNVDLGPHKSGYFRGLSIY